MICYDNITITLEAMEIILDDILLSGINVIGEGTIKEIEKLTIKCRDIGLKEGSEMLLKLGGSLHKKRHTINFDSDEIIKDLLVLGTYVSAIKDKIKSLSIGQ